MSKKYILKLTESERRDLEEIVRKKKASARKIQRAQVLLACDQEEFGLSWIDEDIARAYACATRSVESWRKEAVLNGPLCVLERKKYVRTKPTARLTGEDQARLTALVCSSPPSGYGRWTLRLLANQLVELEIVETISHETVRTELKKANLSLG
jgi:hypothetical protein